MKRIFIVLVLLGLFSMPLTANATGSGFFDNGITYMDSSMWSPIPGDDSDPLNVNSAMTEVGNTLEWTVAATGPWPTEAEAWKGYASKWVLDLNSDFMVSVDFHYNPISRTGSAGLNLGFYYFDQEPGPGVDPFYTGISVENWDGGDAILDMYSTEFAFGGPYSDNFWSRGVTDGTLTAAYIAATDTLTLADGDGAGSAVYSNLRNYNSYVGIALNGYAFNNEVAGGEAYFENLQVSGDIGPPPVVPEPISSALFLIGGATMGFIRFRKTKVQ